MAKEHYKEIFVGIDCKDQCERWEWKKSARSIEIENDYYYYFPCRSFRYFHFANMFIEFWLVFSNFAYDFPIGQKERKISFVLSTTYQWQKIRCSINYSNRTFNMAAFLFFLFSLAFSSSSSSSAFSCTDSDFAWNPKYLVQCTKMLDIFCFNMYSSTIYRLHILPVCPRCMPTILNCVLYCIAFYNILCSTLFIIIKYKWMIESAMLEHKPTKNVYIHHPTFTLVDSISVGSIILLQYRNDSRALSNTHCHCTDDGVILQYMHEYNEMPMKFACVLNGVRVRYLCVDVFVHVFILLKYGYCELWYGKTPPFRSISKLFLHCISRRLFFCYHFCWTYY